MRRSLGDSDHRDSSGVALIGVDLVMLWSSLFSKADGVLGLTGLR